MVSKPPAPARTSLPADPVMISASELPVTLFDRARSVSVTVKLPASDSFNQTSDETMVSFSVMAIAAACSGLR